MLGEAVGQLGHYLYWKKFVIKKTKQAKLDVRVGF